MHSSKKAHDQPWYRRFTQAWIVKAVLFPLALNLFCNYLAHWMK